MPVVPMPSTPPNERQEPRCCGVLRTNVTAEGGFLEPPPKTKPGVAMPKVTDEKGTVPLVAAPNHDAWRVPGGPCSHAQVYPTCGTDGPEVTVEWTPEATVEWTLAFLAGGH